MIKFLHDGRLLGMPPLEVQHQVSRLVVTLGAAPDDWGNLGGNRLFGDCRFHRSQIPSGLLRAVSGQELLLLLRLLLMRMLLLLLFCPYIVQVPDKPLESLRECPVTSDLF